MCLNRYDKQVAPMELNTLFVLNATNSWPRRSQRKTNGSRRDNHAVFENICLCLSINQVLPFDDLTVSVIIFLQIKSHASSGNRLVL